METAFELPMQSPTGERIVIDRTATCFSGGCPSSPPGLKSNSSQLRAARVRSSLLPRQIPGPASKTRTNLLPKKIHDTTWRGDAAALDANNSVGSLHELKLRRLTQSCEADHQAVRLSVTRPKRSTCATALSKSSPPGTERKSREENKLGRLSRKNTLDSRAKTDIAPDGQSAGREGRQFTVANVGNNGRIYLRPSVRPAHLRSPQPKFVFPTTAPDTAGINTFKRDEDGCGDRQSRSQKHQKNTLGAHQQKDLRPQPLLYDAVSMNSDWATDYTCSPTALPVSRPFVVGNTPSKGLTSRPKTAGPAAARPCGKHRRAISDLTVQDTNFACEPEPGGFKVVITQPIDKRQRAEMLEDLAVTNTNLSAPRIEIAIPTWKLGTPQFGIRGTPTLYGSSNTPLEGPCSRRRSYFSSAFDHSHSHLEEDDHLTSNRQEVSISRQRKKAPKVSPRTTPTASPDLSSHLQRLPGVPPGYHSNYGQILPCMFDALTFKPDCDDRTIVRISAATNAVTAATPPRLVAEITSPRFMDYELVSDFFLTYRSFIDAGDLLCMLIARLRWAVARDDEAGMIVRVRTFVALRHWILNYFADDYVVDYDLRVLFCDLLNSFVEELKQDLRSRELQLKILTELKKCWRRSCAQFWDGPEFEDSLGAEAPIVQGGRVEKSGTKPKPAFWKQAALGQPSSEGNVDETNMFTQFRLPASSNPVASNTLSRSSTSGSQIDNVDSVLLGDQMASSQSQEVSLQDNTRRQESHMSITSLDVVSCSFPTKNVRQLQASPGRPIGAHPAGSPLACSTSGPIATTPRALTGKRVRPCDSQKVAGKSLQHERSKSLSDSLRERAPATEKPLRKGSDATISLQQPGSLVRGALFPPGQPFVDLVPPGTSGSISRQTTICQPSANTLYTQRVKASAMPSQGMRKLLDSVRRALSTKGQAVSPRYSGALNLSAVGPRITANRLPTTSTVPLAWPRQNGFRCPLRIDLLGAKIAEDFKVAVRESAKMDTAKKDGRTTRADLVETHDATDRQQPTENETTSADSDSLFLGWTPDRLDNLLSPMSDAAMTAESKDIVSVDGERVPDYPEMTGALAIPSSSSVSVDAFEGAFLSPATDPTPPATPPELAAGTPRRSSYTLGQQVVRPSLSMDPVPMFIPDTETLGDSSPVEPSDYPIADASIRHPSAILADGPCKAILNYGPEHFVNEALGELFHEGLHDDIAADKNILFRNSFGVTSPPPIHRPQPSWIQGHSRHRSSRSQKSHFSHLSHFSGQPHSRRRFASFASGAAPGTRTPSFDASTFADVLVDNIPEAHNSQIPRVLRRRPGGDLRAVTNVGDLNVGPIRRSRSVGSLTSYSESLRNSFARNHAPVSGDYNSFMPVEAASPRKNVETFSVGMLTSKKQPTRASQLSTHSSRPVMRPSFEAEAKKLAQIPDDVDDDGGVESALLKLEGRFERKSRLFSSTLLDDSVSSTAATRRGSALQSGPAASQFTAAERPTTDRKNNYRHRHFLNSDLPPSNHSTLSDTGKQSTINILDLEVNKSSSHSVVADEREMESKTNSVHTVAASPLFHPAPASYTLADEQPSLSEILGSNHHSLSLLEPILSDDGSSKRTAVKHWTNQSVFEDTNEDSEPIPTRPQDGLPHSVLYDVAEVVEPVAKNSDSASLPKSPQQGAGVSFLKEDSDDGSDLSSELSAEISDDADGTEIFGLGKLCRSSRSESGLSCLPTALVGGPEIERFYASTSTSQEQHPGNLVKVDSLHDKRLPSPPMTLEQALQMSPDTAKIPELHSSQLWDDNRLPPTPSPGGSGPGAFLFENAGAAEHSRENRQPTAVSAPATSDAMRIFSVHLPFVLAFDSEVLAQQFTLIEKDALHEIDWKELISMRWKTAGSGDQRSWVNFLRNSDARGVEVVIARFNIMVKWTVSEIILTQDLEERARCIIKFIHVAAHCRRYRNFATMSQIAIALTTNEVSRLTSAWALVPPSDRCTLRSLETLVSPTRNFYSLRSEMEAVDIDNANAGCIPFVGVYTHDLLFNAQRPSEIASSPTTAPLVNFERCRTAASIVKTLLRLIEASTNYAFQPVKGITERCLWISALTDDDIRKYSEAQK